MDREELIEELEKLEPKTEKAQEQLRGILWLLTQRFSTQKGDYINYMFFVTSENYEKLLEAIVLKVGA